jgi:hypothetical protein
MDTRERLAFLTKNYGALQGLRFTPAWLFLAISPWISQLPDHRPTFVRDYTRIAGIVFCGVWIWLVGRYYRRRYGVVRPKPHPWWTSLFIAVAIATWLMCSWADEKNLAISFQALWWGCLLGWQALESGSIGARRAAYSVAALFTLALSLLPLTGRVAASQIMTSGNRFGTVFLGVSMVILGVIDHLLLDRLLSPTAVHCE